MTATANGSREGMSGTPTRSDDGLGDVLDVLADGCFGPAMLVVVVIVVWWRR